MIMNNAKANRKIKHILLVLILSLLAVIATSAVSFAEDGHYTVHYETWGLLDDGDAIQDRTGVFLNMKGLEPKDVPVKMGYEFEAWYCDEDFSYRYYDDLTYKDAALAVPDPISPLPDSITLYALVKMENTDDQYVWGRKDSLPNYNNSNNTFNYFLAYDITMGTEDTNARAAWSVPNGTAKINLNGHTIKRAESSKDKGTVIYVPQGKTLVIEDRPVNGKKGMITGGIASDVSGGGIYVEGSLIMSSGEVAGNKARSGGGVAVGEGGSATIQQADIHDNEVAISGGGIAVAKDASLSIDGDIYNNKITAGNLGGGIYVDEEAAKLYFGRENSDGNSHIRIQNNIFYEMREPSDLFLNKDALQAGSCRIIMGDIDQGDDAGNYVGLTLSPWPDLNTDETVMFTSGLGNRRYDFFEPSDSKYEVRTEGEGDAREAVIGTKTEPDPNSIPISIAKASVSGLKAKTWTGKALKQKPVVKLSGKVLKNGTDFTVTYKNNKNVGKATLTITGKRYYTGTIKKTFKINPKGTSLKTLKKGKKSITVKWKKQSKKMSASRITGYQIQLATNKKFTRNKKTVTVKGYKSVSKKVTKLKAKKKYYVKVRTYKTVGGKKYYSPWSKVTSLSR